MNGVQFLLLAITAATDENLADIAVFETTETLPEGYVFIEEAGVMKVAKNSIAAIGAASFEYGVDFTNATVRVAVTETNAAGTQYTLNVNGRSYTKTASDGTVTFTNVEVLRGEAYESVSYYITSTAITTTGSTEGSTTVATTTAWIDENASTHVGGTWSPAVSYANGAAEVSDNKFSATTASTSSRVVLEFDICFAGATDDEVEGGAQAAIKIGTVNDATTFMVLTNANAWAAVSHADLVADPAATNKVVLTIDYGTKTYEASVAGLSLTNSVGSARFPLAASRTNVKDIDFAGSGVVKSIKGDQLEGYMVKDALNNFYATIEAAIQAYNSANGPYTVLHNGTSPDGWKIVKEGDDNILKKIARGLFIIAY